MLKLTLQLKEVEDTMNIALLDPTKKQLAEASENEKVLAQAIKDLLNKGNIVIACGGGGIPVIKYRNGYKGVDAVIDKDRTSARLALDLKADVLLILTAVDRVSINYKEEDEEKLKVINVKLVDHVIIGSNEFYSIIDESKYKVD